MSKRNTEVIGNPVDNWWNSTRAEIDTCIALLGQFPPAPNSQAAIEILPAVRRSKEIVAHMTAPKPAEKIQSALLECLKYLETSLNEQAAHGLVMKDRSFNLAYHQFLMVSYYLLQRGIYEPEPKAYRQQRVG